MADLAARLGSERDFEVLRGTQLSGRPGRSVWTQFLRDLGAWDLADRLLGEVDATIWTPRPPPSAERCRG